MEFEGSVAVVTGGAAGIGAALARRLAAAGARVVVVDLDGEGAEAVADSIGDGSSAVGVGADASSVEALQYVVDLAEHHFGPVDLFCANAGIGGGPGIGEDETAWTAALDVNVLAHVRAARLLLPRWLERGEGYFVSTASAAGLLTQVGNAAYSVTKHAALAFSEWLAISYGDQGIGVSCLCPMGVDTPMLRAGLEAEDDEGGFGARVVVAAGEVLDPAFVADRVLEAIGARTFLVLPHPEVLTYFQRKAHDYDHWLDGMRRLKTSIQ